MKQVEVLVYGAGAVGSVFGWRVAQQSRTRVSVVCRSNYNQVRELGFSFQTLLWGNDHWIPSRVYKAGFASDISRQVPRYDYIILANKIKTKENSDSMIQDLRPLVHSNTTLVSAQNGLDVETPLREAFPQNTILSAVCNFVTNQPHPGIVEQTAGIKPHAIHIGIYSEGEEFSQSDVERRDALVAMDTKFKTIQSAHEERWQKLIFNSAWNSMTALTGVTTRDMFAYPSAIEIVRHLANEAHAVALGSGVIIDKDIPEKVITIARDSDPIVTSTLQDARRGRPLELHSISGYLVSQAAKVGVLIPYTCMVYDQLKQMNQSFLAQQQKPQPQQPLSHAAILEEMWA